MALTASVASLCAVTAASIHWLAVLGVVHDFRVDGTPGLLGASASTSMTFTSSTPYHQLGLASGPSAALTHLDAVTWKLGFVAGIFWVLRLGLRSADRRIGGWRGIGIVFGFGLFVVTGVLHHTTDALIPRDRTRRWVDFGITLWCLVAVLGVVIASLATNSAYHGGPAIPGVRVDVVPTGWSLARNALQLVAAVGGWSIAMLLTREWWRAEHAVPAERAAVPVSA